MKKLSRFVFLFLFVILTMNCRDNKSQSDKPKNREYDELEQLWNDYLTAQKTGEEENIESVSSSGYNFTKVWFDPDRYGQMCVAVGNGWAKSNIDIGINNDEWEIDHIGFKGE